MPAKGSSSGLTTVARHLSQHTGDEPGSDRKLAKCLIGAK
jgi:hypothetical protein